MVFECFPIWCSDGSDFCIYGTKELKNIKFIKFGLTSGLINQLEEDEQLTNIQLTEDGIIYNEKFEDFLTTIDDFYKFQIQKYII